MILQKLISHNARQFNLCLKFGLSTFLNSESNNNFGKIKSWQIHSYGGLDELQLTNSRSPIIKNPNDVIVKILGSSINPIDLAMMSGYGSVLLNFMRQIKTCTLEEELEFPLTLGRDFAGIIIQKGYGVHEYSVGDEVWGVVPLECQGCHAEQVLVPKSCIKRKPDNISMTEAGSLLYAAVTAWSALKITGGLSLFPAIGKTVLVLGGSGGVGTVAIQMLTSWGAYVVTTCSSDAKSLLESLGAVDIIDYKREDSFEKLDKYRFDIILDCTGIGQNNDQQYVKYLKEYKFSKYITLKSPMVKNFDEHGIIAGIVKNVADLALSNFNSEVLPKSSSVRWGFFIPLETALTEITHEVMHQRIMPCIHKTYKFEELPLAYQHAQSGHLRGKLAIDFR